MANDQPQAARSRLLNWDNKVKNTESYKSLTSLYYIIDVFSSWLKLENVGA